MFSNSHQSGFVSIFFSVGSNPLALWDKQVKNGHIRRVIDDEVKSLVLDIGGTNVATTYITCPIKPRASLGIKLPYFVMIIKNMKKYFSFEVQILDDKEMRRRFRVSNFQSTTKVRPFCTTMPIGLSSGWNQVQFNLADFTKRAYGSAYMETIRVQIHANVRIRRIYFSDQLHSDEDLPNEFKLFAPRDQKAKGKEGKPSKEAADAVQAEPVPPIKTDLKQDEEVPPPPSPAEESPIAKEEVTETAESEAEAQAKPEGDVGEEAIVEGAEGAKEAEGAEGAEGAKGVEGAEGTEGEAPPTEEGAESPKTEGEEGTKPAPPVDEGAPAEGEGGEVVPLEAVEVTPDGEVPETPVEAEAAPAEGGEMPVEGETPEEGEAVEAPVVKDEVADEPAAEDTTDIEVTETVAETTEVTTEVTEVTDTEGSPSEPATTDNEGEA